MGRPALRFLAARELESSRQHIAVATPSSWRLSASLILAAALLQVTSPSTALAQDLADQHEWPREIASEAGSILMYSPQVDSLSRDVLAGRAAVSLTREGSAEPVFGAVWFTSRVVTDRDADAVAFTDFHLLRVRVPGLEDDEEKAFVAAIEKAANEWRLGESLSRFTFAVDAARQASASAADLKNTPPYVVFAREPTVLVAYDGEPQVRPIEGSEFERVVNTPYVVIRDPRTNSFFLTGGRHWYGARAATGPWSYLPAPPAAVVQLVPQDTAAIAADSGPPRKIVTATRPTELVVTTGEPLLVPLPGTDLLYVSNTESDLFKELQSQDYYLLLSGRWFRSRTLAGPWSYVPPGQLPATFANIPADSPKADVLTSVPGTEAANDAVADAAIPQTAAINRSMARLEVTYDGEPRFEQVEGTRMAYAVNASTAILRIDGLYYACDQAIWFVSSSPTGPWVVSDSVPPAVQTIPPSSPVYYVKYVQVYQATPEVVYVGYTPGYLGAYPYYGTIVYGTGWYYRPYVGRVYYFARPWTWGLCAHYRPWYGWSFGVSYNWGFLIIGVVWGGGYRPHYRPPGWYGGGWYGPGGYRPPYHRPPRPRPEARPPTYRARPATNIYARPERRPMVIPRPPASRPSPPTREPTRRPATPTRRLENNVFVTPDGQIRRRTSTGWETREGNQWKPAKETRPAPRQPAPQPTPRPPVPQPTPQPAPRPPVAQPRPQPPVTRPSPPPTTRGVPEDRDRLERDYRARTRPTPPPAPRAAPAPKPAPRTETKPQRPPTRR